MNITITKLNYLRLARNDCTKSQIQARKLNPTALCPEFLGSDEDISWGFPITPILLSLRHTASFLHLNLFYFPPPELFVRCPMILEFSIFLSLHYSLNFAFITSCNGLSGLSFGCLNYATQCLAQLLSMTSSVLHFMCFKSRKM